MAKLSLIQELNKLLDSVFGRHYKIFKEYLNLVLGPISRFIKRSRSSISFFFWKIFPSKSSEIERERYKTFINSLGGWNNVAAFTCRAKSWHLKIIHEFLIDWDTLKLFNVEVIYYTWPYLDLALGSYSKWIYKRLKRFSGKPPGRSIPKCSLKKR